MFGCGLKTQKISWQTKNCWFWP